MCNYSYLHMCYKNQGTLLQSAFPATLGPAPAVVSVMTFNSKHSVFLGYLVSCTTSLRCGLFGVENLF